MSKERQLNARRRAIRTKRGKNVRKEDFLPEIESLRTVFASKGIVVAHHGLENRKPLTVLFQKPSPDGGLNRGKVLASYFPTTGSFVVGRKSIVIDNFDDVIKVFSKLFLEDASPVVECLPANQPGELENAQA